MTHPVYFVSNGETSLDECLKLNRTDLAVETISYKNTRKQNVRFKNNRLD